MQRSLPLAAAFIALLMGQAPCDVDPGADQDGDGYTEEAGDCNDQDPTVHPEAFDECGDGIDKDCDGVDSICDGVALKIDGLQWCDYIGEYALAFTSCPNPEGWCPDTLTLTVTNIGNVRADEMLYEVEGSTQEGCYLDVQTDCTSLEPGSSCEMELAYYMCPGVVATYADVYVYSNPFPVQVAPNGHSRIYVDASTDASGRCD